MVTQKKNEPSQRMEQLKRPRHRERGKVRHMIRFVFLKVALTEFQKRLRKARFRAGSGWRQEGQRSTDN